MAADSGLDKPLYPYLILANLTITLVGSVHISFSDIPVVSSLIGKQAGARVVATEAIDVYVQATIEFLSGRGKQGKILGREVLEGDEEPTRPGEGEGEHMEPVGEIRMHFTPSR